MTMPPNPESLLPEKPTPEMIEAAEVVIYGICCGYSENPSTYMLDYDATRVLEAALEAYHRKRREEQSQA